MPIRKPNKLTKVDATEADQLDQNVNLLYENKVESRFQNNNGTNRELTWQSAFHGSVLYSATGSATIARTFSLPEKIGTVVYVSAHCISSELSAHVTDVTQTAVTIVLRDADSSGVVSAILTTGQVRVYYQVIGSTP